MDLIKRHMFFILCGVGAVAGIALGVTGMRGMPKVRADLEAAAGVYKSLEAVGQPINQRSFDGEKERIDSIIEDRDKVLAEVKKLCHYEPLVKGVFPEGGAAKRIEFRNAYHEAMRGLMDTLNWGGTATVADVEAKREQIENEKAAEKHFGAEGAGSGPTHDPATGVLTPVGAKTDAQARASIAAAQRIWCYAVNFFDDKPPDRVSSLEFHGTMRDLSSADAPSPEACWRAQVSYWIQKDVVGAIVALNQEAAAAAKAANEEPWVGLMPVKDVLSLRVSEYVLPGGELYASPAAVPGGAALPAGTDASVFTQSASGPTQDVVQFAVKLVMDQRDIPLLIKKLSDSSLHTLLRVAYSAVPPNKQMVGKIYGAEPAVIVVLTFETAMLGEYFRPWMPDAVCQAYSIPCPAREAKEDEEGE